MMKLGEAEKDMLRRIFAKRGITFANIEFDFIDVEYDDYENLRDREEDRKLGCEKSKVVLGFRTLNVENRL